MGKSVITYTHHGDFTKTEKYLEQLRDSFGLGRLDKYGKKGVEYLRRYTPKDTGLTANSWRYEIIHDAKGATIYWKNDNIQNGVNIAMIIQYGHATRNGGYVEGVDYINPALRKIFREMQKEAQKEVFGIL